jgi:hypothetical protein
MALPRLGATGINLNINGVATNAWSIAAGSKPILPAGQYFVSSTAGLTFVQVLDPVTGLWRNAPQPSVNQYIMSDGVNVRLANLSGQPLGAVVTNQGSGYTSAPTVTPSAGSSTWKAIVGGEINSTITVTTAGAGYNHIPQILISPPPFGGIQATATAAISAGAISSITVTNQGAGYVTAPTITIIPDAADTITTTAVLTPTIVTGDSQKITAVVCTDPGYTVLTSVPTLSFSGGGGSNAAATVVMCFTVTGATVGTAGAGYGNAQPFYLVSGGGLPSATASLANPAIQGGLLLPRPAQINGTSTAGGALTATGLQVVDGGLFSAVPTLAPLAGGSGLATTQGQVTATVGGATDTVIVQPF